MLKNVNRPMATSHHVGACLLHAQCPCAGPCVKAASSAPMRLAPGVIDGPYVCRQTRAQRTTGVLLLVVVALMASVAALVQILPLVRWH
jgi:hypothetical protein